MTDAGRTWSWDRESAYTSGRSSLLPEAMRFIFAALMGLTIAATSPARADPRPGALDHVHKSHAIAMHGDPKYGPDFTHFDYVNPTAP